VLADVVRVLGRARVQVVRAREVVRGVAVGRQVLLVLGPGDALGLEEVDDGADVLRDVVERIVAQAEEISANRSNVVRFRRVRNAVVGGEEDALLSESLETRGRGSCGVVGVLRPDLDEAVEGLARDDRAEMRGAVRRASVVR
jgi:hypothetical protein